MRLTVVRHTAVDVAGGVCYGISDVSLANSAPEDMKNVSERIENECFDAIYSSPLSRCRSLADLLAGVQKIVIDSRLSELNFGDWEMKPWNTIYESEAGKRWFADYLYTQSPNGASYMDMVQDVTAFLNDLKQQPYENVLIVTHAGVIRILIGIFENIAPRNTFDMSLNYGEIRRFELN